MPHRFVHPFWSVLGAAARGVPALAGLTLLPAVLNPQSGGSPVTLEFAPNREEGTDAPSANPVFPLLEIEEVVARVTMPPQPGVQIIRLSLLAATGARYLTIKRAFRSVGPGAETAPDPDSGLALPVEEVPVVNGRVTMLVSIPIFGSALERYGMTGEYEASVETLAPPRWEARGRFTLSGPL